MFVVIKYFITNKILLIKYNYMPFYIYGPVYSYQLSTQSAPVLLKPSDIPGLVLWLDAADSTTITQSSNKVSQWNDKSTSGYNFTQATSANQPTYATDAALNGLSKINYSSANAQYLAGPSSLTWGLNSIAVFIICRTADATTNMSIFAKSLLGGQAGRIFLIRESSNLTIGIDTDGAGTGFIITSDTYTANQYRLLEFVANRNTAKTHTAYQNGTAIGTQLTNVNVANNATSDVMLTGAYNNGSGGVPPASGFYLNGDIAEILIYVNANDMTDLTRQKIEGYLTWKWGQQSLLPSGHPYKNAAPTIWFVKITKQSYT